MSTNSTDIIFIINTTIAQQQQPSSTIALDYYHQLYLNNIVQCLKKWCNLTTSHHSPVVEYSTVRCCVICFDHSTAERITPMQELNLYSMHQGLDRMLLSSRQQQQQQSSNVSIDTLKISFDVAKASLSSSNRTKRVILLIGYQEQMIHFSHDSMQLMEHFYTSDVFVHVIQLRQNSETFTHYSSLSNSTEPRMIWDRLASMPNCTIKHPFNHLRHVEYAMFHSMSEFVPYRPFVVNKAIVILKKAQTELKIPCILYSNIVEQCSIQEQVVCQCHWKPVNQCKLDSDFLFCASSRRELDSNDVTRVIQVGDREIIPIRNNRRSSENNDTAQLVIKSLIDLSDFSHSLVYGPTIIMSMDASSLIASSVNSKHYLYTLSSSLFERKQAALLHCSTDLVHGSSLLQMNHYYAAFGDQEGQNLYVRKVVTSDEYLPSQAVRNNRAPTMVPEIVTMLDSLSCDAFSPLEIQSNFHQDLNNMISNGHAISRANQIRPKERQKNVFASAVLNQLPVKRRRSGT